MNDENDHYEAWITKQRRRQPPEALADAVMQELEAVEESTKVELWGWARAAVVLLAAVVGVGRYGVLIFCLFFAS